MIVTKDLTHKWFTLFAEKVIQEKEQLSEYDRIIGDGDHGMNMARGAQQLITLWQAVPPVHLSDVFKQAAMKWISGVGGASGPLYGTAFLEMAKAVGAKEELSNDELVTAVKAGFEGIKKRGKSDIGQKTMLDLWAPAVQDLEKDELTMATLQTALTKTNELKATKGRASFLGDRSINEVDPGAASSKLFFEALIEAGEFGGN
ncbi:dihydroxyacetone kinase subunit L [Viridibacillus sp. YIM B01967]|uniref:Dihydroxyacetone kinase subunit L n=1 Tax=Viridibacillus soli TaxID=2798301 RepID=A0ABS1H775_9BACL|nr:dihydroxyacetone kinase subunit DhaL [Viridibacillus soli]MBK3495268.1 dihydroxyacetone kinase subunit L [Viridibacillus soli]